MNFLEFSRAFSIQISYFLMKFPIKSWKLKTSQFSWSKSKISSQILNHLSVNIVCIWAKNIKQIKILLKKFSMYLEVWTNTRKRKKIERGFQYKSRLKKIFFHKSQFFEGNQENKNKKKTILDIHDETLESVWRHQNKKHLSDGGFD